MAAEAELDPVWTEPEFSFTGNFGSAAFFLALENATRGGSTGFRGMLGERRDQGLFFGPAAWKDMREPTRATREDQVSLLHDCAGAGETSRYSSPARAFFLLPESESWQPALEELAITV